ncbi:MAG: hypothetical protein KAU26_01270, partial [Methylococcales bacterium]|nr:hypothetical protein [Methylococcales bacterium]
MATNFLKVIMIDKLNKMINKYQFIVLIITTIFSGFGGWFISEESKSSPINSTAEIKNSLEFYTDTNRDKKVKRTGNENKPFLISMGLIP